jgi:hypothetical protein
MDNLYKTMDEMAMRYAQATGHLQGVLISMALYNDVTPSQFKFIYSALERSTELAGNAMSDFDRGRFKQRADDLGVTI